MNHLFQSLTRNLFFYPPPRFSRKRQSLQAAVCVERLEERTMLSVDPLQIGDLAGGVGEVEATETLRTSEVVPGRWIAILKEGVDPTQFAKKLREHGREVSHVFSHAVRGVVFSGEPLWDDPRVAYVEPDLVLHVMAQTLPTGIDRIDADLNTFAKIDGVDERVNVDIAILDTGIDATHPDLYVFAGRNFSGGPASDYDDRNGHGTHVAGTAAALDNGIGVVGVAPGARLWAAKVLSDDGSGYLSDIIAGVDWVTANADQIEVANMSLGGTGTSSALRTAIQNSVAVGVVYVVAAGNSGQDVYGPDKIFGTSDDFLPASYLEVMTISAFADSDGEPGGTGGSTGFGSDDSFASFSNFSTNVVTGNPVNSPGAAIDLLMPGVNILSTYKDGQYATMSGTSMAAPHAAGLVGLYIAANGRDQNGDGIYDAQDVYAIRQAMINSGVGQNTSDGLAKLNDPDSDWENIGWTGELALAIAESFDISALDADKFEGDSGGTPFTFLVTRSGTTSGSTSVDFLVSVITADGNDFVGGVLPSGTIHFADGELQKVITLLIQGDLLLEPNESFTVTLTNPASGATVGISSALGIIGNDENIQVFGAGSGIGTDSMPPQVIVRHAETGQVLHDFLAYASGFRGGVRVAAADVNGDGVADVITAPGPGGGPHVRVFDGLTAQPIADFFAYGSGFMGGVFVAASDMNGDGFADLITGAGAGGGPHVKVFDGQSLQVRHSFFAYAEGFTGGVTVAAGDANADGLADVITGPGAGGGPHVKAFDGQSLQVRHSFFAYAEGFTGGVTVAAGDVNGDGFADIVTGPGAGGGPHVRIFNGQDSSQILSQFFAFDSSVTNGLFVGTSDMNGDGFAEILVGTGPGRSSDVRVFNGLGELVELGTVIFDPNFRSGVHIGGSTAPLPTVSPVVRSESAGATEVGIQESSLERDNDVLGFVFDESILDALLHLESVS